MKARVIWWCLAMLPLPLCAADRDLPTIEVRDPFVEIRTFMGSHYPVFEVAERGERLQVIKQRARWYKVRTPRQREGWVEDRQLLKSLGLPAPAPQSSLEPASRVSSLDVPDSPTGACVAGCDTEHHPEAAL